MVASNYIFRVLSVLSVRSVKCGAMPESGIATPEEPIRHIKLYRFFVPVFIGSQNSE